MKKQIFDFDYLMMGLVIAIFTLVATPSKTMAEKGTTSAQTIAVQKTISRKSIEWWNSDLDTDPDSLFAEGYINHQEPIAASDGEKGVTLNELKSIVTSYHSAFPGTHVDIKMQIAEGNHVATHWTFTGVQKGTYQGLAPTNKTVSWSGISIDEYNEAGKIITTWVVWDKLTMFKTLGLIQ